VQPRYNLLFRQIEREMLPFCAEDGVGVIPYNPIAGGLLSGKHRRNQAAPEGTRQFAGWTEPPIRDEDRLWNIVDVLVEIADARGVSAAQVALAWTLGRPGITSVIIGGRTEAQFADNLKSADLKLTEEERARLDKVSQLPLLYPYWHQRNTASDRLGDADRVLMAPFLSED
jgi:aryl-alcohol dehydrogenase-like predicted oxidoreductase